MSAQRLPRVSLPAPHAALVVGGVSSPIYASMRAQYNVIPSSGSEDPSAYDMVILDANSMPGQFGVSAANFLQHGKAVVIFNDTEARRHEALKGVLFAHGEQDTPAEAFFIVRDTSGTPQREVQVNFPLHMTSPNGGSMRTLSAPQATDIPNDTKTWLADLQKRMRAPGSSGDILLIVA